MQTYNTGWARWISDGWRYARPPSGPYMARQDRIRGHAPFRHKVGLSPHPKQHTLRIILWTASPLLESKRHSLTFIIIQGLNFLIRQFTFFENCPISHVQASNPYLLPTLQETHTLICLCSPMTFSQKWQLTRGVEARAKMGTRLGWVSKSLGRALPPLLPYLLPDFL